MSCRDKYRGQLSLYCMRAYEQSVYLSVDRERLSGELNQIKVRGLSSHPHKIYFYRQNEKRGT